MYARKLPFDQQIEYKLRIPTIIFLTSLGDSSNISRMPNPNLVPHFLKHSFEPATVTACL
jgi:hypothetical protein